jgi:hypothetical protein
MTKSSMIGMLMSQYTPVDNISTTLIEIIGTRAVILEGKKRHGGNTAVLRGAA